MSYKKSQRSRVENLLIGTNIFNGDPGGGYFRSKRYPFILDRSENNLYAPIKNAVIDYFNNNKITWWSGKLTNHPLSSQVACLNHLFPIRDDKEAVLAIVKKLVPKIEDIFKISTDKDFKAYIQFEAVSDCDHLNEKTLKRGSNCTSIDALIYGVFENGKKILFLIEWKYAEVYSNVNKASGVKGRIRKNRYTSLINSSSQLKNCHNLYYFEPFYQLMRQTLWAEQMIINRCTETIKANDYLHIHVIPKDNRELLNKKYPRSGKEMKETWNSCLNDQNKYVIISPECLLTPIIGISRYSLLLEYLEKRYW